MFLFKRFNGIFFLNCLSTHDLQSYSKLSFRHTIYQHQFYHQCQLSPTIICIFPTPNQSKPTSLMLWLYSLDLLHSMLCLSHSSMPSLYMRPFNTSLPFLPATPNPQFFPVFFHFLLNNKAPQEKC